MSLSRRVFCSSPTIDCTKTDVGEDDSPCAVPHYEPPCKFRKWKLLIQKFIALDLHLLISIPLFIVISFFLFIGGLVYSVIRLTGRFVEKYSNPPAVRRSIREARRATDFSVYSKYAERLDKLTGRDKWKISDVVNVNAPGYDANLVRGTIHDLISYRKSNNVSSLVQCVRSCLDSQLLGTLNPALYSMTFSGTKLINEELQNEIIESINFLSSFVANNPSIVVTNHELFVSIKRLPKYFGISSLFLSGGAMLGLHHLGLLESLVQNKLLPNVICGTSAGSSVAAFACTRTDEEILQFLRDPKAMEVYQDPFEPSSWIARILYYLKHKRTVNLNAWLRRSDLHYGRLTFLEAYQITHRVLNIGVTRAGAVGESMVLNYHNAPNVLISSAVLASSAFPWFVQPLHLMEKDPQSGRIVPSTEHSGRYFQDGSLRGDVPVAILRNRWGANFIVVSQVNFFAFPFLGLRCHGSPGNPVRGWGSVSVWRGGFPLAVLEVILKEFLRFLLRVLALLEVIPSLSNTDMTHLALQNYGGDLNVYPSRLYWQHLYVVSNVSRNMIQWFLQIGRQMVFPRMWILKARLNTEASLRQLSQQIGIVTKSIVDNGGLLEHPDCSLGHTLRSGSTMDGSDIGFNESPISYTDQSPPLF